MRRRTSCPAAGRCERGQSLVEFALVIPIFLLLVIGIAEFGFLMNARVGVTYGTQNAAQLAAALGPTDGADCFVLLQLETELTAPLDKSRIDQVDIFWADTDGTPKATNTWKRQGKTTCPNGKSIPWHQTASGYAEASRCNIVLATGCEPGHAGVDWIGVRITYSYKWITPFPGLVTGTPKAGPVLVETTTTRLEPVQ